MFCTEHLKISAGNLSTNFFESHCKSFFRALQIDLKAGVYLLIFLTPWNTRGGWILITLDFHETFILSSPFLLSSSHLQPIPSQFDFSPYSFSPCFIFCSLSLSLWWEEENDLVSFANYVSKTNTGCVELNNLSILYAAKMSFFAECS